MRKVRRTLKSQFGSSLQWMRITKRIQNSTELYLLSNDDFKRSYIRPFAVHLHWSSIDFTAHYPYLQSCSSNAIVMSISFYPDFILIFFHVSSTLYFYKTCMKFVFSVSYFAIYWPLGYFQLYPKFFKKSLYLNFIQMLSRFYPNITWIESR